MPSSPKNVFFFQFHGRRNFQENDTKENLLLQQSVDINAANKMISVIYFCEQNQQQFLPKDAKENKIIHTAQ